MVPIARTLIDIDDDHLAQAMVVLGTTTKAATVNQSLADVAHRASRLVLLEDLDTAAYWPPSSPTARAPPATSSPSKCCTQRET